MDRTVTEPSHMYPYGGTALQETLAARVLPSSRTVKVGGSKAC